MSEYKYTYITKGNKLTYIGLNEPLDPACYNIGESYEDYMAGKWVLLSADQVQFKEEHPDATVEEVLRMTMNPVVVPTQDPVESKRQELLSEAKTLDKRSDRFYISVTKDGAEVANQQLWLDKDTRSSLYAITLPSLLADGETTTKLWTSSTPPTSIDVPITWAMDKLQLLEIYAKRTHDVRARNEAAIYAAKTVEELEAINLSEGYPLPMTFELNLDL